MPAVAERTVRISQQPQQQQEGFGLDAGGMLFKKVTPRMRQDKFGRKSTRHADYLLSMSVFPTGVRTPLLSDLQQKSRHQCGFEVTEKGTEKHVHILDSARQSHSSRHGSANEGAKQPPPNTPLTVSKMSSDRGTRLSVSMPPSSRKSSAFQGYRWVKSTEPGSRCSVGNSQGGRQKDIRDPLYLNTYCPGERKLRFKKTSSSLPRIFSRNRPWTVSESNPAYRFARNSQEVASSQERRHGTSALPRHVNFRIDAKDVRARAKPHSAVHASIEQNEEEDRESTVSGSQALLEVKSYFPHAEGEQPLEDQREGLRGKEGCLHSRVKQCIKFVKHRDRIASRVERPMKQEHGKYRPFSTTRVRTPNVSPADSPRRQERPDPKSVDTYKEYMDTIALQTRLVSAVHKRRKTKHPVSGLPRYNTAASSYYDNYDARTLQSVADSNRPPGSSVTTTDATATTRQSEGSNPATSAAGGAAGGEKGRNGSSDPLGVHQALDIIRLSPKVPPPRLVKPRGSRADGDDGDVEEEEGEEGGGREWEGEGDGGEEEVKDEVGRGGGPKKHAIFLPNASATTSVCSFSRDFDDPVNVTDR